MAQRSRYGSGSIRPKGEGRWELRVSVGRDPATRSRYISRTVRGSKREAEAALAGLLVGVSQRRDHQTTDATVRDLVEQWLDLRRETRSVTTYEAYLAKARYPLLPALGDVPVRELGVRDIDALYRTLSSDVGLAASTVRQIHNSLTGSLDQDVRWGWRTVVAAGPGPARIPAGGERSGAPSFCRARRSLPYPRVKSPHPSTSANKALLDSWQLSLQGKAPGTSRATSMRPAASPAGC